MTEPCDPARRLVPNLFPELFPMTGDDLGIVELVGLVVVGGLAQLRGALNHTSYVLSGHLGAALDRGHDLELRSEGLH